TSTTDATSTTASTATSDPTDGTETSDTTGDPPADACAETVLPEGNGVEIVVSPSDPGMVEVDGQKTTLREVVMGAQEGDTILLQDGLYTFNEAGQGQYTGVYFTKPNVILRSQSGDASAVILDSEYKGLGGQSGVITIDAPGVVVADLTVRRSIFHLVHLWANADDVILHNLELVDGGEQFVKSSSGDGEIDGVQVSCSRFLMTDEGRDNVWGYGPVNGGTRCYTGGIDTHEATNWVVRDNLFSGIYCDAEGVQRPAHGKFPELRDGNTYNGGLAEHAIHMWDSSQGSGHTLTRNRIVNCARGIGLGLVSTVYGATITNNTVFSEHAGSGEHDVGITVDRAVDTLVAHNTVFFSHPDGYANGIEYRWGETNNLTLHGNLSNRRIRARDGATAALSDNVAEMGDASWFVDAASGDLHLADCAAPGEAGLHADVPLDLDAEPRSEPTTPGADQCAE
ncbi:MAG: hypothetical protein KC486_28895, partial [Myxococcales bacterium]|nr:hypothetical protein [Myxococcales bacterium]